MNDDIKDDDWYSEETATFGDRLAAARDAAGLSQKQLAQHLGGKLKTVRGWEDASGHPGAGGDLHHHAGQHVLRIPSCQNHAPSDRAAHVCGRTADLHACRLWVEVGNAGRRRRRGCFARRGHVPHRTAGHRLRPDSGVGQGLAASTPARPNPPRARPW